MSAPAFGFTDRVQPICQIGLGDIRVPTGQALWGTASWDVPPDATWAKSEPTWLDVSCYVISQECSYGRARTIDRFIPGTATVLVDNTNGWADPQAVVDPAGLTMRPGRQLRLGVVHDELGTRWLFRGYIDAMTPTYTPAAADAVQIDCIDALGEVNRAVLVALETPIGQGDHAWTRIMRILDAANWPKPKRSLELSYIPLGATDLGGQVADLLGVVAESVGGAIYGDVNGNIRFRNREWLAYEPGLEPPDGTISNWLGEIAVLEVEEPTVYFGDQVVFGLATLVCPTQWVRPFDRADIATRVIVGRESDERWQYVQRDDIEGQAVFGIEPFERTYLLTVDDYSLDVLADRYLATRSYTTAPRVRAVTLDASTADNVVDLMATVDVFKPSRYLCQLWYEERHSLVFEGEYFATGVHHYMDPRTWSLDLNLDLAVPYTVNQTTKWDTAQWSTDTWPDII